MRTFFLFILFLFVALGAFVYVGGPLVSPYVQKIAIQKLNETQVGEFDMDKMIIHRIWPLDIQIQNFYGTVTLPLNPVSIQFSIPDLRAKAGLGDLLMGNFKQADLELQIQKPKVWIALPKETAKKNPKEKLKSPNSTQVNEMPVLPILMNILMKIVDGTITIKQEKETVAQFDRLNIDLSAPDMLNLERPKSIEVSTLVSYPSYGVSLPVALKTKDLVISPQKITSQKLTFDLSGLAGEISGASNLNQDKHKWQLSVNLPNLDSLKIPPAFLPSGIWQGGIIGSAKVDKDKEKINLSAAIETQNLQGDIDFSTPSGQVKGKVSPKVKAQLTYAGVPAKLKIETVTVDADLTKLDIKVPKLLLKPAGVPLLLKANGHGDEAIFQLQNFAMQFHNLNFSAAGSLNFRPGQTSEMKMQMPLTQLQGLEVMVLPLKDFPLKGAVGLEVVSSGDIFDPINMNFDINRLQVVNLSGGLNFESQDKSLKLSGPFGVNVIGSAQVRKMNLVSANIKGNANFTKLAIFMKDTFQKKSGELLLAKFNLRQKGQTQTVVEAFNINSDFAALTIQGKIEDPNRPRLQLKTKIQRVDLTSLSKKVNALAGLGLSGQLSGDLSISGVFDSKGGVEKSPLALVGKVHLKVPQYVKATVPQPNLEVASNQGPPTLPESEPLLPNWPLFRNSDLAVHLELGQLRFDSLIAKQIQVQTQYSKGVVRGVASVGDLFGGSVKVPNFSTNNLLGPPQFKGKLSHEKVKLVPLVQYLAPAHAEKLVSGELNGEYSFSTNMPQTKEWLTSLVLNGKLDGQSIRTKEDLLQKALGDKLSSLAEDKKILSKNPTPINANLNIDFSLSKNVVQVKNFQLKNNDDSEFQGSGSLGLDMKANLKGTAYLANVNVRGAVRAANSDNQGRFIVPLELKGSLLDPSFDIAKHTIEQIAKRTLQYEAKRVKENIGQDLKKAAGEKVKEKLKGLFK